jgi:hypothetical protein
MPASRRRGKRKPPDLATWTDQQRQIPHLNTSSGESSRFCTKTIVVSSRSSFLSAPKKRATRGSWRMRQVRASTSVVIMAAMRTNELQRRLAACAEPLVPKPPRVQPLLCSGRSARAQNNTWQRNARFRRAARWCSASDHFREASTARARRPRNLTFSATNALSFQ